MPESPEIELQERIITQSREVLETFYQESNLPPRLPFSVQKLCKAIARISGFQPVPVVVEDMGALRGMLIAFPEYGGFDAFLSDYPALKSEIPKDLDPQLGVGFIAISDSVENNECWKRFTIIKEASHLYWEQEALKSKTDVEHLARAVVDMGILEEPEGKNSDLFFRDHFGILAAMELLLPEQIFRPLFERKIIVEKKSAYSVAYELKVPKKFVEIRMAQWDISLPS